MTYLAPQQDYQAIYAAWLALGGALAPGAENGVAPVVAAGQTAAVIHGIGDFVPDGCDFIVPARKGTRLSGVRLRIRRLAPQEVIPVSGLPALTVERTLADLVEIGTDLSLVAGAARDAVQAGKLTAPDRLAAYPGASRGPGLSPSPTATKPAPSPTSTAQTPKPKPKPAPVPKPVGTTFPVPG